MNFYIITCLYANYTIIHIDRLLILNIYIVEIIVDYN